MRIGVLGPMVVGGVDDVQLRDRTVLGVLFVGDGRLVGTDEIADAIWGEAVPTSCRKIIQGSVMRLRRELGADAILTVGGGYRLSVGSDDVDAQCFAQRVDAARGHLADGFAARAVQQAREALALWRGSPLPELEDWAPAAAETRRLSDLRDLAEDLLLEARLLSGYAPEVVADAERLVAEAPFREARWLLWVRALYATGRQAAALAAIARLRTLLREELGVDPVPDVVALELAILNHDPELAVPAAVGHGSECPWPGLLPYEASDARAFFGREGEIEACAERLDRDGVVVVVGRSGCGKSSLVRAGLMARLLAAGRAVQIVTPGTDPLEALAGVPAGSTLVVDQAEEAVTQCADDDARRAFFDRVSARDAPIVLVARADCIDSLAAYRGFAALLERGLFVLQPLDEAGLREVVDRPAAEAGVRLEPGLTELLVRDCGNEPGALPLLSHALAETWRRAEGNTLTVAGYRASGGIQEAVATTAERVFDGLNAGQQRLTRALFLRLVVADDGDPIRVRVPRGVATDEALVERLLAARLISVADNGDLQLAHEALARHWPRLREWLAEDRAGQRVLRHLSGEALEWDTRGRPAESLYRGVRLQSALAWVTEHEDETTTIERDFVEASRTAAEHELATAREQTASTQRLLDGQRRNNRRLRLVLAAAAVLLVASIIGATIAVRQATEADRARDSAQAARDVSEALRIGALADAADEPSIAFGLAAEALTTDGSRASRVHALEVFGRFASLLATAAVPPGFAPRDGRAGTLGWQDGRLVAFTAGDTVLLDQDTLAVLGTIAPPEVVVQVAIGDTDTLVGLSPTGDWAFVLRESGARVELVEATTGRVVATRDLPDREAAPDLTGTAALSPDGALLAVAESRDVLLLDASLALVGRTDESPTTPSGLAFDSTGRLLAGGYSEEGFADTGTSVVWNVATGAEVHRAKSGSGAVWSHTFAPDSASVYTAGADGIRHWDLSASRALVRTPDGDPLTFRAGDFRLSLFDDAAGVWIAEACRLAGRPLTSDEWGEFVGDRPYRPVCAA